MAQSWLIARGCPKDAIRLLPGIGTTPADDTTRALEERLAGDGDHFAVLASYTHDTSETPEITVLLRAVDEAEPRPFRVLLERIDPASGTHTLQEGQFRTVQDATAWWNAYWSGENPQLPPAAGTTSLAEPVVPPPATQPPGRTR
ncbi:hypothetical protein ABZ714_11195 [Streptomyces sp. NPDC006798]|uniref:hypothetical protein n=1 Tax=Streptomyces sp. NPDC006798 TaxID=3155462 RepID=UPI0033F34EE1